MSESGPTPAERIHVSLLPFVAAADNFPLTSAGLPTSNPETGERYVPFHVSAEDHAAGLAPVGLIRPAVLEQLLKLEREQDSSGWAFVRAPASNDVECVVFASTVLARGREGMDAVIAAAAARWKHEGLFKSALDGWRNELYAIYASPRSTIFKGKNIREPWGNLAFSCERAACAVFGFATFGVHMTAYEGEGESMKIWVPRRSKTKATWPGMLDNTVAGGITSGMNPRDTMIKECDEEASLPEAFVEKRLRNVGLATYWYITETGFLQPEVEYLYDLPLPSRESAEYVLPKPHDDEVESFALWDVPNVVKALQNGEFKPNCGLILVDFLVRHGLVTPENEAGYIELCWRMRRRLGIAMPA